MATDKTTASSPKGPTTTTRVFTAERANQALVLVRQIVTDVVRRYERLSELRREREELLPAGPESGRVDRAATRRHERLEELNDDIGRCVEELNDLNRELSSTGCVLKDCRTGLVDFPAMHGGRRVWLCWRLGEPAVAHWHGWHAGVAGRMPIGEQFE